MRQGERGSTLLSDASLGALRGLFGTHGQQLLTALIRAIAGVLPPSRIRFVAPLLKSMIEIEAQMCSAWANAAIQALPAEIHADGAVFIGAAFSREALRDEKTFVAAADAFGDACRRKRITP